METKGRRGGRGSRISQVTFVAAVSQKPGGEAERHVMEWSVQEASRGCGPGRLWRGKEASVQRLFRDAHYHPLSHPSSHPN